MNRYKMIALDMDGTLLNEQSQISEGNLRALHEAIDEGMIVCLSTGRGIFSVEPFLDQIRTEIPIVTANGSEVWERRHQLLSRVEMDPDLIIQLREWALQHDIWYWATTSERVYNKQEWCEDAHAVQWLKFGYYTEDLELLEQLRRTAVEMDRFEITNSHPANLEFNPKGVNKASGLQKVCDLLGLTMQQVIAMGDSLNDMAMIRAAGLGVAMGNAQDVVKESADMVTLSNEHDGVAHIIRKIVLNQA